jgi:hypothetical protein
MEYELLVFGMGLFPILASGYASWSALPATECGGYGPEPRRCRHWVPDAISASWP